MTTSKPRLADHLASFGREPASADGRIKRDGQTAPETKVSRPGTEVDLGQFGLNR